MTILLPLALVVLMVGVFAALMTQGLWGNLLMLFNVVVSGLLAINFYEPIAKYLTGLVPSGTMFWDIIAIWAVFGLALVILKMATDQVSRVKVRFKKPLELAGGYLLAACTAYVFMAFAALTLHLAPLSRDFMWGGFRAEDPIFFGFSPDRQWLGFTQLVSRGSLARLTEEGKPEQYLFDPKGELMPKYASRREKYEKTETLTGLK